MMKRASAVSALLLTLAACGGQDTPAAPPSPAASAAAPAADSAAALAGTYGAARADGMPWTTTLQADGRYSNTMAGQVTESGRWTRAGDQLCFTASVDGAAQGSATATPPVQVCQTLVAVNPDGGLVVRDAGGHETTAPRLAPQ